MTTFYRIPLTPHPCFTEQVALDGVTYSLRFRWSERDACWHMDMHTVDGEVVALSVRLVSSFPLLRRVVRPTRPPGELVMLDLSRQLHDCDTLEDFGGRYALYYVSPNDPEVAT